MLVGGWHGRPPEHSTHDRFTLLGTWQNLSSSIHQREETQIQPLCPRCRTNQVLLLNYKANYFPADEEVRAP